MRKGRFAMFICATKSIISSADGKSRFSEIISFVSIYFNRRCGEINNNLL